MKNIVYSILSAAVLFGFGCKRETMVGEENKFANKDFAVTSGLTFKDKLGSITLSPNFAFKNVSTNNPCYFSASFNQEVTWTVRVDGLYSQAYKEITGTGNTVNIDNAIWQGEPSSKNFFYFSTGGHADTCIAKLYVKGIDTAVSSNQIIIKGLRPFNNLVRNGVKYHLIDDFDDINLGTALKAYSLDAADLNFPFCEINMNQKIQGLQSLHMEGVDVNNNGWLISVNNPNLKELQGITIDPSTTESDLYFNLYLKGNGKSNTTIELKLYEFDTVTTVSSFNTVVGDANFTYSADVQAHNDGWIYDVVVDWEGWKLVSVPYTKFRVANDPHTGGNGNHKKEPWKITAMALSLLSYPGFGATVSADADYVFLTEGGPFVPLY